MWGRSQFIYLIMVSGVDLTDKGSLSQGLKELKQQLRGYQEKSAQAVGGATEKVWCPLGL